MSLLVIEELVSTGVSDDELLQEVRIPVVGYVRRSRRGGRVRVGAHRRTIRAPRTTRVNPKGRRKMRQERREKATQRRATARQLANELIHGKATGFEETPTRHLIKHLWTMDRELADIDEIVPPRDEIDGGGTGLLDGDPETEMIHELTGMLRGMHAAATAELTTRGVLKGRSTPRSLEAIDDETNRAFRRADLANEIRAIPGWETPEDAEAWADELATVRKMPTNKLGDHALELRSWIARDEKNIADIEEGLETGDYEGEEREDIEEQTLPFMRMQVASNQGRLLIVESELRRRGIDPEIVRRDIAPSGEDDLPDDLELWADSVLATKTDAELEDKHAEMGRYIAREGARFNRAPKKHQWVHQEGIDHAKKQREAIERELEFRSTRGALPSAAPTEDKLRAKYKTYTDEQLQRSLDNARESLKALGDAPETDQLQFELMVRMDVLEEELKRRGKLQEAGIVHVGSYLRRGTKVRAHQRSAPTRYGPGDVSVKFRRGLRGANTAWNDVNRVGDLISRSVTQGSYDIFVRDDPKRAGVLRYTKPMTAKDVAWAKTYGGTPVEIGDVDVELYMRRRYRGRGVGTAAVPQIVADLKRRDPASAKQLRASIAAKNARSKALAAKYGARELPLRRGGEENRYAIALGESARLLAAAMAEARIPVVGYVRKAAKGGVVRVKPHRRTVDLIARVATPPAPKAAEQEKPTSSDPKKRSSDVLPRKMWSDRLRAYGVRVNEPGSYAEPASQKAFDEFGTVVARAMDRYPALRNATGELKITDYSALTSPLKPEFLEDVNQGALLAGVLAPGAGRSHQIVISDIMAEMFEDDPEVRDGVRATLSRAADGPLWEAVGWHETAHALARLRKLPTTFVEDPTAEDGTGFRERTPEELAQRTQEWKRELERFGIDSAMTQEMMAISAYAASDVEEAVAELHSMLVTPGFRDMLSPQLQEAATRMFNAWGGIEE